MANEEQLAILKQGVDVWNRWREENPDAEIDLSKANLKYFYLSKANLRKANLSEADLDESDLYIADLTEANLNRAGLFKANLGGAKLCRADISGSYCVRTNFSSANLKSANFGNTECVETVFFGANFEKTNFIKSHFAEARFLTNDFSSSIGLEQSMHSSRSFIDIETIQKSKGKIPVEFLRGCGRRPGRCPQGVPGRGPAVRDRAAIRRAGMAGPVVVRHSVSCSAPSDDRRLRSGGRGSPVHPR